MHKLYLKRTIRKERDLLLWRENLRSFLKNGMFPCDVERRRCRFINFSGYVWNSPDVRTIAIYEPRSPTDEIARSEWKTTILKTRALLGAHMTRVCIARSRKVYHFSVAADLYALRHNIAYPSFSPLFTPRSRLTNAFRIEDDTMLFMFFSIDNYFCNFFIKCKLCLRLNFWNCENNVNRFTLFRIFRFNI